MTCSRGSVRLLILHRDMLAGEHSPAPYEVMCGCMSSIFIGEKSQAGVAVNSQPNSYQRQIFNKFDFKTAKKLNATLVRPPNPVFRQHKGQAVVYWLGGMIELGPSCLCMF